MKKVSIYRDQNSFNHFYWFSKAVSVVVYGISRGPTATSWTGAFYSLIVRVTAAYVIGNKVEKGLNSLFTISSESEIKGDQSQSVELGDFVNRGKLYTTFPSIFYPGLGVKKGHPALYKLIRKESIYRAQKSFNHFWIGKAVSVAIYWISSKPIATTKASAFYSFIVRSVGAYLIGDKVRKGLNYLFATINASEIKRDLTIDEICAAKKSLEKLFPPNVRSYEKLVFNKMHYPLEGILQNLFFLLNRIINKHQEVPCIRSH